MRELYYGAPPKVVRRDWPQAPILFYDPQPAGFGVRKGKRSSRHVVRDGHNFEKRVLRELMPKAEAAGWFFFPEFHFVYKNGQQEKKSAYIDCLAINPRDGVIAVLEMKRTHTPNSFAQIWRYMAFVKSYFGDSFAVLGYEICDNQGLEPYYPGPCRWLCPGQMQAKDWNGRGLPEVSIVPWYTGRFYL